MEHVQAALAGHGIWVVLGLVLASGAGLPLPAPPVLLAAGVLADAGRLSLAAVLAGSLFVLLATDLLWYQLGRWRGHSILGLLCRISLEPDSCVQRTEDLFSRHRGSARLVSKFLPGLKTAGHIDLVPAVASADFAEEAVTMCRQRWASSALSTPPARRRPSSLATPARPVGLIRFRGQFDYAACLS